MSKARNGSTAKKGADVRRSKLGPVALALFTQIVILIIATTVVILIPESKEEPKFVSRKKIYLPQKELEHKVALAEFQNAASSPMRIERVRSAALLPDSMPALPELPQNEFNPIERHPLAFQSESLLGQSGLLGAMNGLKTESSSTALFGIQDSGERILILFDNSTTVWNKAAAVGVTTDVFVQELSSMVEALNANTLFGLVPFARKVGTFRDYLVAAGARNKRAAKEWIAGNVRSYRKETDLLFLEDGIQGALTVAFQMEPDVIFILSDGDFQRSASETSSAGDVPWDDVKRTLHRLTQTHGIRPRIHFVGFQVEANAAEAIAEITKRYDGVFSEFSGP